MTFINSIRFLQQMMWDLRFKNQDKPPRKKIPYWKPKRHLGLAWQKSSRRRVAIEMDSPRRKMRLFRYSGKVRVRYHIAEKPTYPFNKTRWLRATAIGLNRL